MQTLRPLPLSFLVPAWSSYQLRQLRCAFNSSSNRFTTSLKRHTAFTHKSSTDTLPSQLQRPSKLVRVVRSDRREENAEPLNSILPEKSHFAPGTRGTNRQATETDDERESTLERLLSVERSSPNSGRSFRPSVSRELPTQSRSQSVTKNGRHEAKHILSSRQSQTARLGEGSRVNNTEDVVNADEGKEQGKLEGGWQRTPRKWSQGITNMRPGATNTQPRVQCMDLEEAGSNRLKFTSRKAAISKNTGKSSAALEALNLQKHRLSLDARLPTGEKHEAAQGPESAQGTSSCDGRITFVPRDSTTVDDSKKSDSTIEISRNIGSRTPKLSLLEELFPVEAKRVKRLAAGLKDKSPLAKEIDRLHPPEFDDFQDTKHNFENGQSWPAVQAASQASMRTDNLTVLVHYGASPDLVDTDYQRVVPRGTHIGEWRGLGDIVKVIPCRDPHTLLPLNRYYLLFPNPAFARAFQNRAKHLHRLASAHTPTSITSPILPIPGTMHDGEDIHVLLKNYSLAPSSQPLFLRALFPPYTNSMRRLLAANGFPNLTQPVDRSGRSILFWVDSFQPSTISVKNMLARDGQDRGIQWAPLNGKGSITLLERNSRRTQDKQASKDEESETEDVELRKKLDFSRWVISFEDETEARRFIRAWHMRPYPLVEDGWRISDGEPEPLIHAQFLW